MVDLGHNGPDGPARHNGEDEMENEWFPVDIFTVKYYDGGGVLQKVEVIYRGTSNPWHGVTDYVLFGLGGVHIEEIRCRRVSVVADEYVRP